ncbi:hypothetical protein K3495_g3779 [Podosphaera aphanis]|nr:hypothetical protein K3495_g3779 [Podosphaera aphanis]
MSLPFNSEEYRQAWGKQLAAYLAVFPLIAEPIETLGFSKDPTRLISFFEETDRRMDQSAEAFIEFLTILGFNIEKENEAISEAEKELDCANSQLHTVLKTNTDLHDKIRQQNMVDINDFGAAHENNRIYFDEAVKNPNDPKSWTWKTATQLFTSLDAQYETINLKLDASIKFVVLYQKKTPFPNFIALFQNLSQRRGKTEEQKVEAPKKKVSVEIAQNACTNFAFADLAFTHASRIDLTPLPKPRNVIFADGITKQPVTHYFVAPLHIGYHTELSFFYVTKLSPETPLILGLPWLQKHNPRVNWEKMAMQFNSKYCKSHCLPPGILPNLSYAPPLNLESLAQSQPQDEKK